MKRTLLASLAVLSLCSLGSTAALAAETTFNPNTQFYDMNGSSRLSLWGVPEAGGQAVWADSKESWHTELSVATWMSMLLKAQQLNMNVVVGYDPVNFEIWYVAKPRP